MLYVCEGNMEVVREKISLDELKKMSKKMFESLVKAVVDIEKNIMAVDAELHADEEALLIENGSQQQNLWGINIYPELEQDEYIEFDSMINLKPSQGNFSRSVGPETIKQKIINIVNKLIKK